MLAQRVATRGQRISDCEAKLVGTGLPYPSPCSSMRGPQPSSINLT